MTDMVLEEVRRAVADCIPGDSVLRIRAVATRIAERIREEQVSVDAVSQYLLEAAVVAGIPIELDRMPSKRR